MRILIAFASKTSSAARLAAHIAAGCRAAGTEPEVLDLRDSYRLMDYLHFLPFPRAAPIRHDISPHDLIFLGFEIHNLSQSSRLTSFIESNDFRGKKVALFCTYYINRKYLQRIIDAFGGKEAEIFNTISLKRKGPSVFMGKGELSGEDLARAEAFAERTVNNFLGVKVRKESEKSHIRGYRK